MEDTQICSVCGHTNPAAAVICENPQCQMVLGIRTIPISPSGTLKAAPRGGSHDVEHAVLLYVQGSSFPLEIRLLDGIEVVMGRYDSTHSAEPVIDLTGYGALEKGVSRKHAILTYQDSLLKVSDLESLNSTYLNGDALVPHQPQVLRDGDVLVLGTLSMTVRFE